jgi:flagellar motor switch protein FliM
LPKLASRDLMLNETSSKKSRNQELKVLLGGAQVNVEADLGNAELSLGNILDLDVGDVIRLNNSGDDIVTLKVDGKDRFKGEIGLRRFRKSIQVTEIIDTEKDAVKRALKRFEDERFETISGVKNIINEDTTEEVEDDDE